MKETRQQQQVLLAMDFDFHGAVVGLLASQPSSSPVIV
jgi:hypothetical protein